MSHALSVESLPPLDPSEGLRLVANNASFSLLQGAVEVEDARALVPYTIAVPDTLQHDTTAIIGPGFGAFKRTSRRLRDALAADQGLITVSYDPARLHSKKNKMPYHMANPQALHYATIEAIAHDLGENEAYENVLHGHIIQNSNLTLIAHSMGGMPISEFAADNHAIIDQVVYLGSIGMQPALGLKVLPRAAAAVKNDIIPGIVRGQYGRDPVLAYRSWRYFAGNPLRTASEIVSCARADIRSDILRLRGHGVHQSAISFETDDFFPPEETELSIGPMLDDYEVMEGYDHTAPQKHPTAVAKAVGRLLIS